MFRLKDGGDPPRGKEMQGEPKPPRAQPGPRRSFPWRVPEGWRRLGSPSKGFEVEHQPSLQAESVTHAQGSRSLVDEA